VELGLRKKLMENFNVSDYLKDPETGAILRSRHLWNFCDHCEPKIIDFYRGEVARTAASYGTVLARDRAGVHAGTLAGLLYKYIEPQYDLEIFYNNPELAQSLLDNYQKAKEEEEMERLRKQRENYQSMEHAHKTFDWATRTYK
jgi:hypothetical protein